MNFRHEEERTNEHLNFSYLKYMRLNPFIIITFGLVSLVLVEIVYFQIKKTKRGK
jgi:hypothetical protein